MRLPALARAREVRALNEARMERLAMVLARAVQKLVHSQRVIIAARVRLATLKRARRKDQAVG